MSSLDAMISAMYGTQSDDDLEKTAEENLLAALRGEESPLASYSTADLEKIAASFPSQAAPDMEKVAEEMLGGQVMAHALVHEMGLIKEAMLQGLCRVCKESPMDIQGASICSSCADGAE